MSEELPILAVCTSGPVASIALGMAGGRCVDRSWNARQGGSDRLGDLVKELLEEIGVSSANLHGVGVNLGPGSYTGARIGVTFAKVMSYALDIPLFGASVHEILASAHAGERAPVAVINHGHRGRAYGGVLDVSGARPVLLSPVGLVSAKDMAANLPDGAILMGDGLPEGTDLDRFHLVGEPDRTEASLLQDLARLAILAGEGCADLDALEPMYLQPSAPERAKKSKESER